MAWTEQTTMHNLRVCILVSCPYQLAWYPPYNIEQHGMKLSIPSPRYELWVCLLALQSSNFSAVGTSYHAKLNSSTRSKKEKKCHSFKLRRQSIVTFNFDFVPLICGYYWSPLTKYKCCQSSFDELVDILRLMIFHSPSQIYCHIVVASSFSEYSPDLVIKSNTLQQFKFSTMSQSQAPWINTSSLCSVMTKT